MSRYDVGCGLGVGAREYGVWDTLAVGLGPGHVSGARACLGAIETHGDMSACAREVGHRA